MTSSMAGRKAVAVAIAVVLTAAFFPLRAQARHDSAPTSIELVAPAPAGTPLPAAICVGFTIVATSHGVEADGEPINIRLLGSDHDVAADLSVHFCDPDGLGPATNLDGPEPAPGSGAQTGNGLDPAGDCDDLDDVANNTPITIELCEDLLPGTRSEEELVVTEVCTTDAEGRCHFGIYAFDGNSGAGSGMMTAYFDGDGDKTLDLGEPMASLSATLQELLPAPPPPPRTLCGPTPQERPEGTAFEFRCRVLDENGVGLAGQQVTLDVIDGPNADHVGPTTCASPTDAEGRTSPVGTAGACRYVDVVGVASPTGVDSVVACVNAVAPPGHSSSPGCDAHEAPASLRVSWVTATSCGFPFVLADTVLATDLNCGLTIGRDNVTLDLNGHTLQGSGSGIGVRVESRKGVRVINGTISGFDTGVLATDTLSSTFKRLNVSHSTTRGIDLQDSDGNRVLDNVTNSNGGIQPDTGFRVGGGIRLWRASSNNVISGNQSHHNSAYGIEFAVSGSSNLVAENWTHHNFWTGISADIGGLPASDNLIRGNLSEFNLVGISFTHNEEGGLNNVIQGNWVRFNDLGLEGFGWFDGGKNRSTDNLENCPEFSTIEMPPYCVWFHRSPEL